MSTETRVIYKASRDGLNFRVDEKVGRRWKPTQMSYGTLTRATQDFPNAEVSDLAQQKQLDLELSPHEFEDLDGRCLRCGLGGDWPSHKGGAA
jgi:hypothetical protein